MLLLNIPYSSLERRKYKRCGTTYYADSDTRGISKNMSGSSFSLFILQPKDNAKSTVFERDLRSTMGS